MSTTKKLGALAVAALFAAALAGPADAQQRQKSGSSSGSGAKAAPRSGGGGGQSAGPRSSPRGSGQSAGARQPQGPRPSPGAGPEARPRPAGAPVTGRAVPRPAYGPGQGGRYPNYGYGGHYPYYGYRGYYPYYGYRGYYYGYYPGFYWGFGAYLGPYYYSPWLYSSYYYPYDAYYYDYGPGGASLKVEVQPKTAEVFVDGYLAGIVDQFDGMFQSLAIEPGEHEVTVYQEGYRSIRQRLYLSAGSTLRMKGVLEKLAPGEANDPRPQPAYAAPQSSAQVEPPQPYRSPEPQGPPPDRPASEAYPPPGDGRYGQVAIRVQPADAEVFIDGEPWRTQAGVERLIVQLAAGTHRVEIRREGYEAFATTVEIRRGETAVINVSLSRF
jgi:hypothetical protein